MTLGEMHSRTGAFVAVWRLAAYIGRHPKGQVNRHWNRLPEKPGDMIVHSMRRLFGEVERMCFHCKSGGRVRAVAAGFAAVMHALRALARWMVRAAGIPKGLYVPCLFLNKCVFATACITLPAGNEQAEDRKHK